MFGRRITLFRLFGFAVRVDAGWTVVAVLITWSLAEGFFPIQYRNLSTAAYWLMGGAGALGLFLSIVFHEMSHSLVARRYDLPIKGITLFLFGGVAEMDDEPKRPKVEFLMAIAGPLSSILLGAGLYLAFLLGLRSGWPRPVNGVIGYLSLINFFLAAFNLIPAFPLDGGRVLRALLWGWKKDIRWATRIASALGSGFGFLLLFLGGVNLLQGNGVGGVWQLLIGLFLRNAARMSYRQVLMRETLEGEPVGRLMRPNPVAVSPSIPLERLVRDYFYRYPFKTFPVVQDGKLVGCIDLDQIRSLPRSEWGPLQVGELMKRCPSEKIVSPDLDAMKALSKMNREHVGRLWVAEGDRLVGIVSLKDLLHYLSVKTDLKESEKKAA